ncbi:MAG TPA: hypothetical protein VFF79_06870 [Conexibacter sp.]|jgi:hypothetical protein|nr:hypothetical protein [Conexibacter sp.]
MLTSSRLTGVALAILTMLVAVQSASANHLSISQETLRVVWPEESKINFSNTAGGIEISCALTLEGSFHSKTIVKTSGSLMGYVTRAIFGPVSNCLKTNVTNITTLTASLPWHIRYDSFTGTLPAIGGLRLQVAGFAFLLTAFGASCLYRSTAANPFFGVASRESGGVITGLQAEEGTSMPLFSGGILCPASVTFSGTATRVTKLGETAAIRLTLI